MLVPEEIQSQFPILKKTINKNRLVYFDNAASTQNPICVVGSLKNYYTNEHSNVHRGVHFLSNLATNKMEETRVSVKDFIGAKKSCEIIFTKGTTESINIIANGFQSLLSNNDEIIVSEMEHHSNIVSWQRCCDLSGATLKVAPILTSGELDITAFNNLLSKNTKLVAITHVSNTLGVINPIEEIIQKSHLVGAQVLIDGAQAVSSINVDVKKLNVDFYVFSAHKMYGPTGVGVLYGKDSLLNKMPPYQLGGGMIKEVSFEKTTYADLPHKLESGTPNISGIIAFKNSIDFISNLGIQNISSHIKILLEYATSEMLKIKGITIYGLSKNKSGIISFNINGIHSYDIGVVLNQLGVAVRTGHHCTQPIMKHYKISGTVRISFAVYNTKEEVDLCIEAIKKAKKMLS